MAGMSESSGLIDMLDQSVQSQLALVRGFTQSALVAQHAAQQALQLLQFGCGQYGSGNTVSFDMVSRQAHMAAFELMTYAEVCALVGVLTKVECDVIMYAAKAMQSRVLHHEELFLEDALSPSDVFYDDLIATGHLKSAHNPVTLGVVLEDGQQNRPHAPMMAG